MLWLILLCIFMLFNTVVSVYMFGYFNNSLKSLKESLTKSQIVERRKTNGIGMTELLVLLTLQIIVSNLCGIVVLVAAQTNMVSPWMFCPVAVIWFIPAIIVTISLIKMLQIKNRVQH